MNLCYNLFNKTKVQNIIFKFTIKRVFCANTNHLYSYGANSSNLKTTPIAKAILEKNYDQIADLLKQGWKWSKEPQRAKFCNKDSSCLGYSSAWMYSIEKSCRQCEHHLAIDFMHSLKYSLQMSKEKKTSHDLDNVLDKIYQGSAEFIDDFEKTLMEKIVYPDDHSEELDLIIKYLLNQNKYLAFRKKFEERFKMIPVEYFDCHYEGRDYCQRKYLMQIYITLLEADKRLGFKNSSLV